MFVGLTIATGWMLFISIFKPVFFVYLVIVCLSLGILFQPANTNVWSQMASGLIALYGIVRIFRGGIK